MNVVVLDDVIDGKNEANVVNQGHIDNVLFEVLPTDKDGV